MPDARTLEIANEQRFVDRVYERVEVTRTQARALAREGHERAAAGPVSRLVERDAMVFHAAARLHTLDAESEGLVFGRLDFDDGETYRIGRLGLRDENREALLVDWRAPAAAAFYRATPVEPLGVVRRRVIICRGPEVVDLDDDLLAPDEATDLPVLGEGALLAALRRSRGPHMRDIVTTIQREQDEAIRAPVRGVTLITGGPGTGKTQVALHRAAYLLYTDRGRFADGRVLVVGPSTVFTSYIGRVLPALGEDSVHLRAIGELVDGVTATRRDRAPVAEVKGSDRMRSVLVELMWQAPPTAPDRLRVVYAGQVLTLDATALGRARRRVRARADDTGTPPNAARGIAAAALLDALWARVDGAHLDRDDFIDEVGDRGEFQRFLHAWWPRLSPPQVLSWLRDPARARPVLGAGPAGTLAASDYAARLLPPGIAPTRSYRPGGLLSVRRVDDLHAAVHQAVREAPRDGTVAVIATDRTAATLAPLVDSATVVPASLVKGLEYDHVIVVEPAEILAAEPRGRSRLYVVLTRAVAGLVVLHRAPLPAALRR